MNPLDFISVRLCISFVLGISLGWLFPLEAWLVFLLLALSLSCLLVLFLFENYRKGILFGISVLSAATCLGLLSITLAQPKLRPDHYAHLGKESRLAWQVRVKEVLKPSAYYEAFILEVEGLNGAPGSGLLLGKLKKSMGDPLGVDDRLLFYGQVRPLAPPPNPHQFPYNEYMKIRGVYDQVVLKEGEYKRLDHSRRGPRAQAQRFQYHIRDALRESPMERQELGVLQAILLGEREELDPEIYRDYRDAGAAHILAVSGLHIGILLFLFRLLLYPLLAFRHGRTIVMFLSIILIWGYALFTGFSPSVVRAVTMFSFLTYALYINRPSHMINVLALSMIGILLVEPRFLFQVGFQLSYAAVLAIAWVYPLLLRAWRPRFPVLRKLWKLTSVSLAAQMGVMPICIYYFHQFPTLFLLSSLILVPFLGILMGTGVLVVVLTSLNALPDLLAVGYSHLIGAMNSAVGIIAGQELFILRDLSMDKTGLVLLYLLLISLVLSLSKPRFRNLIFLGVSMVSLQIWALHHAYINSGIQEVYLLHQMGHTGLIIQDGKEWQILGSDPEKWNQVAQNYRIHRRLDDPLYAAMPRAFSIEGERWLVLDSTGILPPVPGQLTGLVLTQSPKVHLGRVLEKVQPQKVIADGSNYRSQVERWKETCRVYGIPFYSTAETGALRMDRM